MYESDMYEAESLAVEIAKRKADVEDHEWELEALLDSNENCDWGSEEAAMERNRLNALADAEIRDRLNATEFSRRAHARLDYLLSVAFTVIGVFHRKRALSLCEEIQRRETCSGSSESVN
jgi:hypothetical protein